MQVTTVGIDLAKHVFQVHGITKDGEVVFNRAIRRAQFMQFFTNLEPCLIGMEACGSSHYWARELTKLGHDVRLIPANYVKPYVKRGKSDANDAEAICEAVTRPTMRFVAPKSEEQQAVLFLHRARDLIVRQRTQLSNMLRSLLAEFGVIIPQGTGAAVKYAKGVLEGEKPVLPQIAIDVLRQLSHQLVAMHLRFRWYEMRMRLHSKLDKRVMLLRTIPGRWTCDCFGHCRHCRRREAIQEWSAICGLVGPDTSELIQRRKGTIGADHENGRPIHPASFGDRHDSAITTNEGEP